MRLRIARLEIGLVAVSLLCGLALGCASKSGPAADATAPREIEIRLVVVDDPPLAEAIERLRSEWKARSGATVSIAQSTAAELLAAPSLADPTDALVYPSWLLGSLAERGWLAPLPAGYARNRELAWSDTFELLQIAETTWGQVPLAVPLGSPVFTCYYRPDLLARVHRRPPRTWTEYHELAELFQIDTMEPLVGGPAFVRALEELVAAARLGPADPLALDPAAARKQFLEGHCALALSWPGHAAKETAAPAAQPLPVGFAELPGSTDVYNFAGKDWERRQPNESTRVPLLGVAGRVGSIAAQAHESEHTFQFLAWLSGKDWGDRIGSVSGASPWTTLYRHSQIRVPQPWVDPGTDAEAADQYAASVRDALNRRAYLFALRVPGQDRYLAALDAAVAQAVGGVSSAAAALEQAAAEWTKITRELGLEDQRRAYRRSLGLDP